MATSGTPASRGPGRRSTRRTPATRPDGFTEGTWDYHDEIADMGVRSLIITLPGDEYTDVHDVIRWVNPRLTQTFVGYMVALTPYDPSEDAPDDAPSGRRGVLPNQIKLVCISSDVNRSAAGGIMRKVERKLNDYARTKRYKRVRLARA